MTIQRVKLSEHPSVLAYRKRGPSESPPDVLDAAELRELCLQAGADDVAFVDLAHPDLAEEREPIDGAFPAARWAIAITKRMARENVRSPARSVANVEFHQVGHDIDDIAHRIVRALEDQGVRAMHPAMAFPMEAQEWPGRMWVVSHKRVAQAAGLGVMGLHRNLIHPKFGSFVLLGTVLVDRAISKAGQTLDYDPCIECKLCVGACPVGAVSKTGEFDFSACYTHNYREFMGGFVDFVDTLADAGSARELHQKVRDDETVSMWQSLTYGANYKAAYCMAVCPAGDDVLGPFLDNRAQFKKEVLKPLTQKEEDIYVVRGSDAEAHTRKRFPHKRIRRVKNGLRVATIPAFLWGMPLRFSARAAGDLDAVYHLRFTEAEGESHLATVQIRDGAIDVQGGHQGTADLELTADSASWLAIVNGQRPLWGIVLDVLMGRLRPRGKLSLLRTFQACFPG